MSLVNLTVGRYPESGGRFGRYELLEKIGAGGMSEVYRALDPALGRYVALKLLPEAFASCPARLASFAREARTTSSLNHPNILTVHDVGQAGGRHFIVTELVEGRTLRKLLQAEWRLPLRQLLDLGVQVAEGLSQAHAAGIVHRDLKPENVMVTPDGRVKVLDFGIAKLQSRSVREASDVDTSDLPTWPGESKSDLSLGDGPLIGTPGYISPEQARGLPVDHRSDQFSFGTVLYEMATGQSAFRGENPAATVSAIIGDEPIPLGQLRPELPAAVRWVVERCLAKDPDERYASTEDLAQALRGLRVHLSELERERRASPIRAAWIWRRLAPRRALPWRLAVVAVLLALIGVGLLHSEPWIRWVWSPLSGAGGGRVSAGESPPLESMNLRCTLGLPVNGGPVAVEGRVERWRDEVRITARLIGGMDARSSKETTRLDAEILTLAAALAEVLGDRGLSARRSVMRSGDTTQRPRSPSLSGGEELKRSH